MSPLSNALVGIARRSFNEFQFQFQLQSEMYLALMPTAEWLEGGGGGGTGSEPSAVAFRGAINLLICFDAQPRMEVREGKRERVTGRVKQREVQRGGGRCRLPSICLNWAWQLAVTPRARQGKCQMCWAEKRD